MKEVIKCATDASDEGFYIGGIKCAIDGHIGRISEIEINKKRFWSVIARLFDKVHGALLLNEEVVVHEVEELRIIFI